MIYVNSTEIQKTYALNIELDKRWCFMKMRKVPKDLLTGMQNARKDMYRYERMERYVMNYLLEAGRRNDPVEEFYIKAGFQMLRHRNQHSNREVIHHPACAA